VKFDFVSEHLERAAGKPRYAVRVVACTPASDLVDPATEPLNISVPGRSLDDRVEEVRDPSQSELARATLPG
jgi:hypothetical protein